MKQILLILSLFVTFSVSGQIVISSEDAGTTTADATSFAIPVTYSTGDLFVVFVASTFATAPATPTLINADFTFAQIVTHANATQRITVFTAEATATASTNITSDFGAETETSFGYYIFKITGYDAATPILQSATGGTTGANPTIAMSSIGNILNAVVAVYVSNTNPLGGTATGGFSEVFDLGGLSPTRGFYGMHDVGTIDNNPTVTAASSTWAGIAIEIKSAIQPRRRIIID